MPWRGRSYLTKSVAAASTGMSLATLCQFAAAKIPHCRQVPCAGAVGITQSPGAHDCTAEPAERTRATPSKPAIAGKGGLTGYFPSTMLTSEGLIGAAKMSRSSSSGMQDGSISSCSTCSTSLGAPCCDNRRHVLRISSDMLVYTRLSSFAAALTGALPCIWCTWAQLHNQWLHTNTQH